MAIESIGETIADPPANGAWRELHSGGVRWGRLPVPGMLGHINVWLLPAADGWWLADTGMALPVVAAAWAPLRQALDQLGRLCGILVTHHHPDHLGMAARLGADYGVPVRCSAATYAAAARALQPEPAAALAEFDAWAATHGLAAEAELRQLLTGAIYARMTSGLPAPAPALQEGEWLPLASSWQVSLHDGHAPGHACFHDAAAGLLISGDQILPTISPNISLHPGEPYEDPLGRYLDSLRRLRRIPDAVLVLPAHGRPFRGLHARIDALLAEHAGRLRAIDAALDQPRTLAEIVRLLFRVQLTDPFNRMLAIGETLAHLRYLELRGGARRVGSAERLRWLRPVAAA